MKWICVKKLDKLNIKVKPSLSLVYVNVTKESFHATALHYVTLSVCSPTCWHNMCHCVHTATQSCITSLEYRWFWTANSALYFQRIFFGGEGASLEVRINIFFSRSGHKIRVRSKLAKSMGTPSNSMRNDGKEENRHKQTHKWVWGRHHYPAYTSSLYGSGNKRNASDPHCRGRVIFERTLDMG